MTGRWSKLKGYLELCAEQGTGDFNVGIGSALCTLQERHNNNDALLAEKSETFTKTINQLRLNVARSLTANSVTSLQSCHDDMLRLHALADVEAIANARTEKPSYSDLSAALKRRLDVLGGYIAEKQYLLGIRRAAMELAWVQSNFLFGFYRLADFFFLMLQGRLRRF
jgi:serine/threonine-protein kinase ATR